MSWSHGHGSLGASVDMMMKGRSVLVSYNSVLLEGLLTFVLAAMLQHILSCMKNSLLAAGTEANRRQ